MFRNVSVINHLSKLFIVRKEFKWKPFCHLPQHQHKVESTSFFLIYRFGFKIIQKLESSLRYSMSFLLWPMNISSLSQLGSNTLSNAMWSVSLEHTQLVFFFLICLYNSS